MGACGSPEEQDRRAETATAVRAADSGATVAPPDSSREIYIDSVAPGNPLVVRGRARTFENTVQVLARDTAGATVMETFETSVGEMGKHNPFEARVWLVRDPGSRVTVEAFEYSANDGSVRSLVSRTVPIPGPRFRATLMFPTSECTTVKAFERAVPRSAGVAQLLAHMLVAGPTGEEKAAGATSPFPAGSRVRSVVLRGGVVTVDFNERLQNVGGSCAAQAIRTAVRRR